MAGGGIRQGALGSSGGGERRTREALPFCVWRSLARRAASPDGHPSAIRQVLRRWASLAIRRHLVGNSAMRRKRAGVDALGNACVHGKMMPGSVSTNVCPPCCALDGRPSALRGDVSGAGCQDRLRRDIRPRCARTFCWGVTVRCLLCRKGVLANRGAEKARRDRRSGECAYPCRKGVSTCIGERLARHRLRIRVARKSRAKALACLPEGRS